MGLLGQLVGWDQFRAQQNAVTAQYLLETADPDTRRKIATHIVNRMFQIHHGKQTVEEFLANLNNRPRGVQMQFVAVACIDLGISPNIPNHVFNYFNNPYSTKEWMSDKEIRHCVNSTRKLTGIDLNWPGMMFISISSSYILTAIWSAAPLLPAQPRRRTPRKHSLGSLVNLAAPPANPLI